VSAVEEYRRFTESPAQFRSAAYRRGTERCQDKADAAIAELTARIEELNHVVAPLTETEAEAVKALGPLLEAGDALHRAEQAEATIERIRQSVVHHKHEAALYNNEREYECLTAVLRIINELVETEEGGKEMKHV